MEGLETILTRRSIRSFETKPIEEEKIKNILHAGMSAPSAHNSQPWEFVVVKDGEKIRALSRVGLYSMPLKGADTAVAVLGNLFGYAGSSLDFFIQDCAAATQNMLLAAHAQGLGGVWMGVYPKQKEMQEVRAVLQIPEEIIPFCLIAFGYPVRDKSKIRAYREEKVFFEKYK